MQDEADDNNIFQNHKDTTGLDNESAKQNEDVDSCLADIDQGEGDPFAEYTEDEEEYGDEEDQEECLHEDLEVSMEEEDEEQN